MRALCMGSRAAAELARGDAAPADHALALPYVVHTR